MLTALVKFNIFLILTDRFVGRTDDLTVVGKLLHAVRAPADDPGDREDRRIKLQRKIEHIVDEAGIEIDVDIDALVDRTLCRDDLGGQSFDERIERKFVVKPFFLRKFLNKGLEDNGSWVGLGVYRMADAVDKTGVVEGVLVQELLEVVRHLTFV